MREWTTIAWSSNLKCNFNLDFDFWLSIRLLNFAVVVTGREQAGKNMVDEYGRGFPGLDIDELVLQDKSSSNLSIKI